jgi:hypothetical protein
MFLKTNLKIKKLKKIERLKIFSKINIQSEKVSTTI